MLKDKASSNPIPKDPTLVASSSAQSLTSRDANSPSGQINVAYDINAETIEMRDIETRETLEDDGIAISISGDSTMSQSRYQSSRNYSSNSTMVVDLTEGD